MPAHDRSKVSWLSKSFEQLRHRYESSPPPFDVVIIGSGYGGAIAADTLTTFETEENGVSRALRICVLERGNEYLPGSFPANSTELPGHLRSGPKKEGLYDIRVSPDVGAVISNGVGGGSLINAGVMLRANEDVFSRKWPESFRASGALDPYYERCELLLGSTRLGPDGPALNTMPDDGEGGKILKFEALKRLDDQRTRLANITVAVEDTVNSGNVALSECTRCGDCAAGCNHGSKDSLDTNLLRRAFLRGAEIFSGATVLKIEASTDQSPSRVFAVHTDTKLRKKQTAPLEILAHKVILAAGTLGSVEILHRSRAAGLEVSRMLGRRCSTNGDTIITHFDTGERVNAVGDEADPPAEKGRRIGSTITGVLDLRGYSGDDPQTFDDLVIEEMAVPGHLRRLFSEIYTTSNLVHRLATPDCTRHRAGVADDDLFEVKDEDEIAETGLYAVMGDDGAEGYMEYVDDDGSVIEGEIPDMFDGVARMRYSGISDHPLFYREVDAFRQLARDGQVIPNPGWQPLPDDLQTLSDTGRGPVVTVHPLGGCVMADHSSDGVVDEHGLLFEGDDTSTTHDQIAVLDGSIIPSALSANPALTIAAVSLRAAQHLASHWGYEPTSNAWSVAGGAFVNDLSPAEEIEAEFGADTRVAREGTRAIVGGFAPDNTEVRVTERMSGDITLKNGQGRTRRYTLELTLRTRPRPLRGLYQPNRYPDGNVFPVDTSQDDAVARSRLRIFEQDAYRAVMAVERDAYAMEGALEEAALWSTAIADDSELTVFEREASRSWWRVIRGFAAFIYNHALRDAWQRFTDRENRRRTSFSISALKKAVLGLIALASRAGECRTMIYRLNLEDAVPDTIGAGAGNVLIGRKRFTYACKSNPWTQLSTMRVAEFPGRRPLLEWLGLVHKSRLALETKFLARIRVPLIEITGENDGVTALGDLSSTLAYIARMTLGIHTWSFRAPDTERTIRPPKRLPGVLLGMPAPEIHEVYLGEEVPHWDTIQSGADTVPVAGCARLTRYKPANPSGLPLLMIHGYSASGTSFAHDAVDGCYARHFHDQGRDAWVADLRSSCGMPTARNPWSFEQMAYRDIPEVVEHICEETGNEKIDVIAHCMGAAMFGMGMLRGGDLQKQYEDSLPITGYVNGEALRLLPARINSAVFSQVSSTVVVSPDNIFRGYVARYFRQLLPDSYEFNPGVNASAGDNLMDRVLSTLPYPEREFRRENPLRPCARTPWTRVRHRMDALYGRVFNAEYMDDTVLRHIDDFFGPMSVDTVSQTIEFARYRVVTNADGKNDTVGRKFIAKAWADTPLLMINGIKNGLADYSTGERTKEIFEDAGARVTIEKIEIGGHQDCLIGTEPRKQALERIDQFFAANAPAEAGTGVSATSQVVHPPWIGPIVQTEVIYLGQRVNTFRIGSRPDHIHPAGVLLTRINYDRETGNLLRPDGDPWTEQDEDYLISNSVLIGSSEFNRIGWVKLFLPPALKDSDGNVIGDAWLVLVIYDEAPSLAVAEARYYIAARGMDDGSMLSFNPYRDFENSLQTTAGSTIAPISPPKPTDFLFPTENDVASIEEFAAIWPEALSFMSQRSLATTVDTPTPLASPPDPALATVIADADHGETRSDTAETMEATPTLEMVGDTAMDRLVTDTANARNGIIPDIADESDGSDEISFVLGSCQYPAAFFDGPVAYRGYADLLSRIEANAIGAENGKITPTFAVLTGDQIYADATAGLYDPTIREGRFELPYEKWLQFPPVRGVLRQIPSYMLLDDHEIVDNWEPIQNDAYNQALRDEGNRSYRKYQQGMVDLREYGFAENGHSFVLFDTRTGRQSRGAAGELAGRINEQKQVDGHADNVYGGQSDRPTYVVSPAMLLPRHRRAISWDSVSNSAYADSWDGYPVSLFGVLAWIVEDQRDNIVFLSGDEHVASCSRITVSRANGEGARCFYSIHAAPAFAPYPFANSRPDLHMDAEEIFFSVDGTLRVTSSEVADGIINPGHYDYRCLVETTYPPAGHGMTYLRSYRSGSVWSLDIEYPGEVKETIDDIAS